MGLTVVLDNPESLQWSMDDLLSTHATATTTEGGGRGECVAMREPARPYLIKKPGLTNLALVLTLNPN